MDEQRDAAVYELMEAMNVDFQEARAALAAASWDPQVALSRAFGAARAAAAAPRRAPRGRIAPRAPPPRPAPPPPPPPARDGKVRLAGQNPQFVAARRRAHDRRRWLLVYYSRAAPGAPPLDDARMRDYLLRFECFACSLEEHDGQWFRQAYGSSVQDPASYCIIDPETGEVAANWLTPSEFPALDTERLLRWLDGFLRARGESLFGDAAAAPLAPAPQSSSDEECGERVALVLEFPDARAVKRARIEVAAGATVRALYRKAAALTGRERGKFALAFHAAGGLVQLDDPARTVADVRCANCLVRVIPQ
jgi:hypothetical protein